MPTCAQAIKELFIGKGQVLTFKEIIKAIEEKYPNQWEISTIRTNLIGCSVNHSSSKHYPSFPKFLYTIGRGKVKLYDPERYGTKAPVKITQVAKRKIPAQQKPFEKSGGLKRRFREDLNRDMTYIDQQAYSLAKSYLPSLNIKGVTNNLIERYLNPHSLKPRPSSKQGLYERILESAQNANMKAGVIGKSIGGVNRLSSVLCEFEPKVVLDRYGDDCEAVLDDIVNHLHPHGQIRRTARSIWPHYCRTILSAALFVEQFDSAKDFFTWVDFFDRDDRARTSLPLILSHEIDGFGFSLSCDFLKELGYVNFPKPDVHLRDIFTALGLCEKGISDYQLCKAIVRVAQHAGVTPYNADKVFWLIGSGNFYDDPHLGSKGRVGSHKKDFIKFARTIFNEAL